MNKAKTIIVPILSALIFLLILIACEDNSPAKTEDDLGLVGSWEVTKMSSEYQGETVTYTESQLDSIGLIWTLDIEEPGTVVQTTNMSSPIVSMPGTWKTSGNKLTLNLTAPNGEVGEMVYQYAIDGNILKLNWKMPVGTELYAEFTKQ